MFAQRFSLALLVSICCTLVVATPVAQKGKPPALLDIPGQADLRCAGPAGATTDGVCGDGDSLYVDTGLAGGDAGVQVSLREGDHQFRLRFDPLGAPNRFLTVFIPERLLPITSFECTGNCLAANTGNPISNATVIVEPLDGQDARIQTTMRNSQGNTIAGGPRTLAVSESALIDVLIGFQDPHGRGYRWALYWSPANYPGSQPATITRTGTCTWALEATDEIVGLRLFNTGNGKNSTRSEGRFTMPFRLTFTADGAAMPGGCSS